MLTNRIRRSKYSVKGYKKLRAEHTHFEKCPSLKLPALDLVEYRFEEETGTCYRPLGRTGTAWPYSGAGPSGSRLG